jgi:hypothetical protein
LKVVLGSSSGWRAQNEAYVKGELRKRMEASGQVMVLIGESTRYLYRYIRWELELALNLGLPIIAVNLNGWRTQDDDFCPPIIRDRCIVHVAYKMAIIYLTDRPARGSFGGTKGRIRHDRRPHQPDLHQ